MFAEFDFSAAKRGPQASTFTELFADVLHPVSARRGGTSRGRGGSPRVADRVVCGCRPRRRAAGPGHASGRVWGVRRCRAYRDRRGAVSAVSGRRTHPLGARPHGVLEALRSVRRRGPADAGTLRGLRGTGARGPRRSGQRRGSARHHRRRTVARRGDGTRRAARRPLRRFVCDGPRAAAPVVPPRRRRSGVRPARGRARSGARRARRRAVARGAGQASDSARHARRASGCG